MNLGNVFWSWILRDCIDVQEKKKKVVVFCSRVPNYVEIRYFHVVVVQRGKRNGQKSVMHVRSCCFAHQNLLFFYRSRWRRRCCLSSPIYTGRLQHKVIIDNVIHNSRFNHVNQRFWKSCLVRLHGYSRNTKQKNKRNVPFQREGIVTIITLLNVRESSRLSPHYLHQPVINSAFPHMSVKHCHDRRGTETKNRIIPHIKEVFELQKQIHMFIRTRQRQTKRGFY